MSGESNQSRKLPSGFCSDVRVMTGDRIVTRTGEALVIPPLSSVARAVRVYAPATTLLQSKVKGEPVTVPRMFEPLRNSTLAIEPSESVAVAESEMVLNAGNTALLVGETNEAIGSWFAP